MFEDEFWDDTELCARCYTRPKKYKAFKLCPGCGRPLCPKHENDCPCKGEGKVRRYGTPL